GGSPATAASGRRCRSSSQCVMACSNELNCSARLIAPPERLDSSAKDMAASSDSEVIARQVSALGRKVEAIEGRLGEIERVIAGLEGAALTTARALEETAHRWDAVYDAMRRQP